MCDVAKAPCCRTAGDQMKKSIELTIEQLEKIEAEKDNGQLTDGRYYYLCQAMKDHYDRYQSDPELDKLDKNIKNINFLMNVIGQADTISGEEFETAINLIVEMQKLDYWSGYFAYTYKMLYKNEEFKNIIISISKKIRTCNTYNLMQTLNNWQKSNYYYVYH
jgi:hypothetical protein